MKKINIILVILWCASSSAALEGFEDVAIHGFISQGYLITTENDYFFSETKDGTFQFNEMGLNFGKNVTDNLRLGIQFLAKDLGVTGNDEVRVDYALADYSYRDWLGLRVGKVKKAFGLYNQTRDVDAGRLSIFLPQSIYNEAYRDQTLAMKGVSLYGRVLNQLDYQAFYGVFEVPIDSGFSHIIKALIGSPPSGFDIDPSGGIVFLWNTPLEGLNFGCTYTTFDFIIHTSGIGDIDFSGYNAVGSIEYQFGNFMFSGEYSRTSSDSKINGIPDPINQEFDYYYATASYRLNTWFEFGGGYSATYNVDDKDTPSQYQKDTSLSLRFDINEYWIFKLEGHIMDGLAYISEPNASEDWLMFAAKLTFSF